MNADSTVTLLPSRPEISLALQLHPLSPRSPQSVLVQLQLPMAGLHGGKIHIPERGGDGVSGLPPLIKRDMRPWLYFRLSFDTVVPNSCVETETSTHPGVESGGSLCRALTFSRKLTFFCPLKYPSCILTNIIYCSYCFKVLSLKYNSPNSTLHFLEFPATHLQSLKRIGWMVPKIFREQTDRRTYFLLYSQTDSDLLMKMMFQVWSASWCVVFTAFRHQGHRFIGVRLFTLLSSAAPRLLGLHTLFFFTKCWQTTCQLCCHCV